MRFEEFLLHAGWLNREEFAKVVWPAVIGFGCKCDANHLLKPRLNTQFDPKTSLLSDLEGMRPRPFGEVLEKQHPDIHREILNRSKLESLKDVLDAYYRWHAYEIQPISSYRQCPGFGGRLYRQEYEKRLVARWLADGETFGSHQIVRNGDYVFIPEGSSGLFAGIAIVAYRKNIHLLTSNGALIREVHENAFLQSRLKGLTVLGGDTEIDSNNLSTGSRGFLSGLESFERAVEDPGATVIVSPVSGLLPAVGPFAPTAESERARFELLDYVLDDRSNLREIAFIADWTKHSNTKRDDYGFPIMNPESRWRNAIERNRSRLSFITCPPAELRRSLEQSYVPVADRALFGVESTLATREYSQAARDFDALSRGGRFESRFVEALGVMKFVRNNV